MSSPAALAVAIRRSPAPHTSMFLRMLWRAAVLRRGRAASALLAMVVAAAAATAMLNLYVDVQAKLRQEFRGYGANVVAVAKDGQTLPPDALQTVNATLAGRGVAVPFAYVVARTRDGHSVVVAGTDFAPVQKLDKWWSVTAWPGQAGQALLGVRAAAVVSPQGGAFDLSFQGHAIHLTPSGTLRTGAEEDSRIYLALSDFEAWTGVPPSTVEIAASGSPQEVDAFIQKTGATTAFRRNPAGTADCGRRNPSAGKNSGHAALGRGSHHSDSGTVRAFDLNGLGIRSPPGFCHHESAGRIATPGQHILRGRSCRSGCGRRRDRLWGGSGDRRLDRACEFSCDHHAALERLAAGPGGQRCGGLAFRHSADRIAAAGRARYDSEGRVA